MKLNPSRLLASVTLLIFLAAQPAFALPLQPPIPSATITSTAIAGTQLGLVKTGLDPTLAGLAGIGVGSMVGSLTTGVTLPSGDRLTGLKALGHTLTQQLAPTLAGELAFFGVQKLGESIGLDPKISQLLGAPIRSGINPGIDPQTGKTRTVADAIGRGFLEGAASIGIQMATQNLDPLVGALASTAITGAIEGALLEGSIFQGVAKNVERAVEGFVSIGAVVPGDPVGNAQRLQKLNEFTGLIKENGLGSALETYATSLLHRNSIESILTVASTVQAFVESRLRAARTEGTKVTVDLSTPDDPTRTLAYDTKAKEVSLTQAGETEEGAVLVDEKTKTAGFTDGLQRYRTPDGTKVIIARNRGEVQRVILEKDGRKFVLSGDELDHLKLDRKTGKMVSGILADEKTGATFRVRNGKVSQPDFSNAPKLVKEILQDPATPGQGQPVAPPQDSESLARRFVENRQVQETLGLDSQAAPAKITQDLESTEKFFQAMVPPGGADPNSNLGQLLVVMRTLKNESLGLTERQRLGALGERLAEKALQEQGYKIIWGPSLGKPVTAPGPDIVAFHPERKGTLFVDNKAFSTPRNIAKVPALAENLENSKKIARIAVKEAFERGSVTAAERQLILNQINKGTVELIATNAGGVAKGITKALETKGIKFLNIAGRAAQLGKWLPLITGAADAALTIWFIWEVGRFIHDGLSNPPIPLTEEEKQQFKEQLRNFFLLGETDPVA